MNPRQRRGVLLIGLSVVGAIAVFLAVSGFVADVRAQVGNLEQVVRLTTDVAPFVPIPAEAIEISEMPARWKPVLAIGSPQELEGMVLATGLPAGTLLESGDIIPPPSIPPGQRQIAILVDAETGVGGNIQVGDIVDVIATRRGQEPEVPSAEITIQQAQILSIGAPTVQEGVDPTTGGFASNDVVPITFVLSPADVLRLAYVESFAVTVRLALRSPADSSTLDPPERVYAPAAQGGGPP
ncbi:MAG: Flp pilus assembly protein CpaB [Euzebya sp.]